MDGSNEKVNIVWIPEGIQFSYSDALDCMVIIHQRPFQEILPEECAAVQRYAQMLLEHERKAR